MIKSKELKTTISQTHSLILSRTIYLRLRFAFSCVVPAVSEGFDQVTKQPG